MKQAESKDEVELCRFDGSLRRLDLSLGCRYCGYSRQIVLSGQAEATNFQENER